MATKYEMADLALTVTNKIMDLTKCTSLETKIEIQRLIIGVIKLSYLDMAKSIKDSINDSET